MKLLRIVVPLLVLTTASCESFWTPLDVLVEHENPVVAVPAMVGAFAAGTVGVPVAVAALPITLSVAAAVNEPLVPLSPVFALAEVGAVVVGGPFYLLFGWF